MSAQIPELPPEGGADEQVEASRRAFLAKCGKFAVVTPPVITLLLHTSMAEADGGYGSPHGKKRRRRRRRRKRRKHNKDDHHHHDHYHRRGRGHGDHDDDHYDD